MEVSVCGRRAAKIEAERGQAVGTGRREAHTTGPKIRKNRGSQKANNRSYAPKPQGVGRHGKLDVTTQQRHQAIEVARLPRPNEAVEHGRGRLLARALVASDDGSSAVQGAVHRRDG